MLLAVVVLASACGAGADGGSSLDAASDVPLQADVLDSAGAGSDGDALQDAAADAGLADTSATDTAGAATASDAASDDGGLTDQWAGDGTDHLTDAQTDGGADDGAGAETDGGIDSGTTVSDTGPTGLCHADAGPGPDAYKSDVPQPDVAGCAWPEPKFFAGKKPPKPTLQLEIGTNHPKTGAFVPYVDGQSVPMVHGTQGGFHVYAAVRVKLPGETGSLAKLQSEMFGHVGCVLAALGKQPVLYAGKDGKLPFTYTTASQTHAGTLIVFGVDSSKSHLYCGRWLELTVRIRDMSTNAWAQKQVSLRLYDTL
ncbi:MAG: hypothetical protein KC502_21905 [Myxococcales bacterium]|nr:hypothetical protein [Myxococcales bacterium]